MRSPACKPLRISMRPRLRRRFTSRGSAQKARASRSPWRTLDAGWIGIAAQALGSPARPLRTPLGYARERKTFGQPIAEYQAIQFMLADMATRDRSGAPAYASGLP